MSASSVTPQPPSPENKVETPTSGFSLLKRVVHPHKLERKHSSGDLHSRLKTRKILGVGETDNGDVHRSKISQILGHSEHLYVKLPRGLWLWQLFTAAIFAVSGIMALLFPRKALELMSQTEALQESPVAIRLYGSALISLAILYWNVLGATDKTVIRTGLCAGAVYFFVQIIVSVCSLVEDPSRLTTNAACLLAARVFLSVINICYYYAVQMHKSGMQNSGYQQSRPATPRMSQ